MHYGILFHHEKVYKTDTLLKRMKKTTHRHTVIQKYKHAKGKERTRKEQRVKKGRFFSLFIVTLVALDKSSL